MVWLKWQIPLAFRGRSPFLGVLLFDAAMSPSPPALLASNSPAPTAMPRPPAPSKPPVSPPPSCPSRSDHAGPALTAARLVVFSGGFSYGDYVMSGRIAQLVTERKLGDSLKTVHRGRRLCARHLQWLPDPHQTRTAPAKAASIDNTSGRFQCRWVKLKNDALRRAPILRDLPDEFELPIAHAEGRLCRPRASRRVFEARPRRPDLRATT